MKMGCWVRHNEYDIQGRVIEKIIDIDELEYVRIEDYIDGDIKTMILRVNQVHEIDKPRIGF